MSMVVMGNVWKHEKCRWWLWEMCGSVRNVDSGYGKCVEMREMSMMAMGIYGSRVTAFLAPDDKVKSAQAIWNGQESFSEDVIGVNSISLDDRSWHA
ncbi:hypothetical protein AVEN_123750-1 [Araneus ventricosus]|uniref:Uncharacterized protein n=1 Tax=Araneus ventricosus TaxID=182803 RepID=A0A4Y2BKT5_ARAVE|nr:hypothetical protein AVEN_123750-1 [Araneus ventricosus]